MIFGIYWNDILNLLELYLEFIGMIFVIYWNYIWNDIWNYIWNLLE